MSETALIVSHELNPAEIFVDGGLDPLLKKIEEAALSHIPILDTGKGRRDIASMAQKVARSKTLLDDLGKDLVSDWKTKAKKVDIQRKKARDFLDDLKTKVRQPLTDWEEAETRRVDSINMKIDQMLELSNIEDGFGDLFSLSDLQKCLDQLETVVIDESFQEFQAKASEIKDECIVKLKVAILREQKAEEERLELERLRREREERERREYEERIAREAAEHARREAEEKAEKDRLRIEGEKKAAEEAAAKAERDRIAAEERAKVQQEQAVREAVEREKRETAAREAARLAKEADEKAKVEKMAKRKAHRARIQREIITSFLEFGLDETTAGDLVKWIDEANVPHLLINY